ncbi:hypothetical protein CBR_g3609 [Chara braunii]|uniref:Uncharacterized protein n=1 Tax=Chara braunii TaxID=69332 RepID=A0A388KFS8_CHABU|nr:hypothetical protein CBR_g3609 [Chara braunii]|eukprot:GBG68910.1 hypothetical protein CBR_g3609 [Chara braunii]
MVKGRGLLTDLRVDKRLQPTQEEHSPNGTMCKVYSRVTFSFAPPAVDDCWKNEGLVVQEACDMMPTTSSDGERTVAQPISGNGYTWTKPLRWWFRPTWRGASRDDVVAGKGNESGRWRWGGRTTGSKLVVRLQQTFWYLEWASQDGSDPLQPPCGPLLFVAVRADRTRLAGSIVQWVDVGEYNFKFTLKKHYRSDGSVDDIAKGCKVVGRMFGGYGRHAMSLPYFVPLAPGHDEAVHVTDFLEVWARSGTSVSAVDVGPGTSISGPVGFAGGECSERGMGGQGGLLATPPDQEVGMSDDSEDDHPRAPSKPSLHGSRRQGLLGESTPRGGGDGERLEREASGNVAEEEEVSEQGLFRERSAEKTQSGGKRNLPDEEERKGVGALKKQRKVGGSARTPTSREGGSIEKRKRVGGGDETPKDSSTQRRTGESSGKRSKSSRGKKADEGDSGEGDEDVDINLNAFNLDNAFFLEMQTGVQKDVVLHIHPERILAIPHWEDAYNHRSLDEFLIDTIVSAMIDCYERKDMRYTKPIFVLAPIVPPPENGEPAVRVLPADLDNSQPEKYWYYPVCGQHNARAAMKVKDHPVFEYYNFCKWPFRPIYFPDDELDGYAHVSCEDSMKDKKNLPRLQVLSMRDIRNNRKIKGKLHVVLDNASKKKGRDDSVFALGEKFYEKWSKGKLLASDGQRWTKKPPTHEEVAKPGLSTMTDNQGLKKHVWYMKVDDPSLKKGKGKPKKGGKEKTFYVQVLEPNVHCWKELVDLTDREKKSLLNGVLILNVVWVQTSSKKLVDQGKFSVKEMVNIIKMDRIMLRLWHYVEFEYAEMNKQEWNANSTFFRSKRQLFEEFNDKGLDDKLWNERRKFFTDSTYVNKCPQFLGCQHDNNIKRTATLINDQHFPAEWNALTKLAQFNVDPLSAIDHKEALEKLGHQLRSRTCVLDLCGTVDRAQWDSGAFPSLSELLGFVCQDYWTLVVFVPCLWNLSFMTSVSALGATRCYTGKWVRKTATKKTHQFGNSVWEEPDVMHILFKGKDPRLLTHPVYEGAVAEDDAAALHRKQKVTPTDVEEKSFKSLIFADIGNLTQRGPLYKDGERNPNQLCNQLLFFYGVVDALLFLGKPHAQVVWSLLQQGRHVLVVDGDTTQLEYTVQYVTHEVSSKAYPCDFHHVVNTLNPADFILDNYKLAFGEEEDFNIETEQEESVEDDLFDLYGQLAIFNAQVSESPSVCKPGIPLATPTSGGPTPVSSSAPVKRGGLSRVRSSPGEPIRLTPQPEGLRPGHPVPPDHLHLKAPATPFDMGDKHTFSTAEDWGHDIVWHPDHFQRVLLDGEWAVAVRDSNKWLEVSSAFYALPSSPSIKQVSWELPAGTPPVGVVKRKSRGKDGEGDGEGGGQRGTGGGSEQRSTKQRSPGYAGGGEGKKGSREKEKPRSGEKTKHHTGDEQGSDVDRDEDGGVLVVTGSTSMETGNDFRPGWITRPGEQDPVISLTSATPYTDAVGGAVVAKNGTCFAQLQKWLTDCLGSIRTSETTSLSGTQNLPGSETTTYHGSGSDKLQPCSIHPNQDDVSAMTDDRCSDTVMLCMEVHKELQADCPTEGELATSFNVEPCTLGAECLVMVHAELAVLSDSPVKADTSSLLETAVARMNPNQGPVSMSLPGAALETTVIRIHPRHTDEGLNDCRLLTTLDKDDSADDRIDPTLGDVGMEQPVQPAYDDPLYSGLHDEAMGEDVLKKSSDAVGEDLSI